MVRPCHDDPVTSDPVTSTVTVLRELLDLLDQAAPVERIAQVAAAAGADAEVEHAAEAALRVRRRLSEHSRREAELTALFDTASDLALLRDTDAVLRSIVHRARSLLLTDTAYLTLNDPEAGQTYMRVTEGSTSALFQRLTLNLGEGLGGLVAQTALPYATANYGTDRRFEHTPAIDAGVADEGLVAILGVPLLLGSTVIGVLYAANRSAREFSAAEVSLLTSLANHAAIALDTARLLEESRTALAELNAANEVIRAHSDAMARAQDAHDRLSDLVLRGGDTAQVAAALGSVLGARGIVVHDAAGSELAVAGHGPRELPAGLVERSRTAGRAIQDGGTWVCAILAGPELLGSITLTADTELTEADRRLFERASVVTALLLLLRRSVAETEDRLRGELITDLLTAPERDPDGLLERGRRLGIDLRDPHLVAVAHAGDVSRRRLTAAVPWLPPARMVGAHADTVVLLAQGEDPAVLGERLAGELSTAVGRPVTVGAAGPAAGPAGLVDAHAEARRCLHALLALGRGGTGTAMSGLGFVGALLGDRADIHGYVRATLGPVLDYDRRRGTELMRTLNTYFACGGSLTRAKDELHVHVNTVAQRLERIAGLLGTDWQEPERALEIQLALRLHAVSGPG
ncbi:helix-turn-helix domain-containing protein [Amycolatopsis aidingensis]|uniref:helix-turn-helix domain-containing protein n=1 Tax=Amycolatopsis aidingensis TaxID=2842453 RepID=UPI001C0E5912